MRSREERYLKIIKEKPGYVQGYNYDWFMFKGKAYGYGTKVRIKQSYINSHPENGRYIWKDAWFEKRVGYNSGPFTAWFSRRDTGRDAHNCLGYFTVPYEELENAIEGILIPNEVELMEVPKFKDWEVEEVLWGWVIYVVVLFFSLIFKEWPVAWAFASFVFFTWRRRMLNR